jgi:putative transposase
MKKSKFTETQIVSVLKQVESGLKVDDVCRQCGISPATYYNWKAKYGGMEASELKKMKDMEAELNQLKKMYADLSLENYAIKELLEKKR